MKTVKAIFTFEIDDSKTNNQWEISTKSSQTIRYIENNLNKIQKNIKNLFKNKT